MDRPELTALRAEMDTINTELVALLQARALLCQRIGAYKHANGLEPVDPAREAEMRAALLAQAGPGFSPEALTRILNVILAESQALVIGATSHA